MFACAAAMLFAASGRSTEAATSGTVVGATVPSASSVATDACTSMTAGSTDFGLMAPGSASITTLDCNVKFGSSNDTSQLRMAQPDGLGTAMWQPTVGRLDVAFDGPAGGANGSFAMAIGTGSDVGSAAVTQPDGMVVIAGTCDGPTNTDACIARFTTTGALDPSFDGPGVPGNGRFTFAMGAGFDSAVDLALQPDGKLLVAGECDGTVGRDLCVARLTATGALDVSFDGPSGTGNGIAMLNVSANDSVDSVEVLADGRILVAGSCIVTGYDFCLARLQADGSYDLTFDGPAGGGNGIFVDSFTAGADLLRGVAVQRDGRVVAVGDCNPTANYDTCLARYDVDGQRDVNFDGPSGAANGGFIHAFSGQDEYHHAVTLQPDGRAVIVGECVAGDYRLCLSRLNPDGSFDASFDGPTGTGNGRFAVTSVHAREHGRDLYVQPDGKIVAVGNCGWPGTYDMCAARVLANGAMDVGFDGPSGSGNGWVDIPMSAGDDMALAITPQHDGRIALAGRCNNATVDVCVISFDQAGAIDDYATGGGFDRDWASGSGTSFFAACLRAVSGGASAQWTTSDPCPASDGAFWQAVPTTSSKVAFNNALEPDPADATAHLRFAMRASSSQAPGYYVAPIAFEVLAPNA